MTPFEALIHYIWILKSENIDLYYTVKDAVKEIRKSVQDKFGYAIVVTPYLIKLEKIPGKAEIWMGIQEFKTVREYQMYCYLLMFLEDKEREEQFVLSSLTEYIQTQFAQGELDWTHLGTRRELIRVIKYAVSIHLIQVDEGDGDRFAQNRDAEVLYENSGISRYVLRNFMRDVMEYQNPEDFEKSEWTAMDDDRGIVRRQRVYRRLLLSPGVYRNDSSDDDFLYIRNYRRQIQNDFSHFLGCELQLHRSAAFINLDEDCTVGKNFPQNNTMSDLILLVHQELRQQIKASQIQLEGQEQLWMKETDFLQICRHVIQRQIQYLPKKYQEAGAELVAEDVLKEMEFYGFLMRQEGMCRIYPMVAKVSGGYEREVKHADK